MEVGQSYARIMWGPQTIWTNKNDEGKTTKLDANQAEYSENVKKLGKLSENTCVSW